MHVGTPTGHFAGVCTLLAYGLAQAGSEPFDPHTPTGDRSYSPLAVRALWCGLHSAMMFVSSN